MSSGFVSGGTIEGQGSPPTSTTATSTKPPDSNSTLGNSDSTLGANLNAWDQVQREVAAERQKRAAERERALAGDERSLYDILQANKAAKQAAFEEQARLSNQFRALDDDDVDFLDRVREAKRREDARLRDETRAGVQAFRDKQKKTAAEAGDGLREAEAEEETEWAVSRRKRKAKAQLGLVRSVKRKGDESKEGEKTESSETPEDDYGSDSDSE
ncbi:hypothetical protein TD95_001732 [Thielaviopsis punctulata]|uniref:FAM192A/Fyv6 N-terminal domain-containing protein n=1 Tax=Thielaviopsis punctulata TaxID=72032 RepID=A0A0F4ZAU5_9PEZI|nr:hypothetical protein TD95_001732 [Thielaviopsis punctulata]